MTLLLCYFFSYAWKKKGDVASMTIVVSAGQRELQACAGLTGRWKDIPVDSFSCL